MDPRTRSRIAPEAIDKLIRALDARGYLVVGPTVRDGAIVYDELEGAKDLPQGWTDEQEAGRYRLKRRPDDALFGYALGPQSWKKYLHPAEVKLFEADRRDGAFRILDAPDARTRPYAFLGVRACEIAAISVLDRVFLRDKFRDPVYASRREPAFLVAVQCAQAAPTCFCASMGTGPEVRGGADLALTEIVNGAEHWFLAEAASVRGQDLLDELDDQPASDEDVRQAQASVAPAARQVRRMDTNGLCDLLYESHEDPRWDQIAERCLTCANCTMVCPTCFCTSVEDTSNVTGDRAGRWRRWDSCFTMDFSYIHGGSVRTSAKARYRQWLTHKLASWIGQFGSSGCVGCGRCIAWCPVGIDLTEEVQAIRGALTHGNTVA